MTDPTDGHGAGGPGPGGPRAPAAGTAPTDLQALLRAPEAGWRRRAPGLRVITRPGAEPCLVRLPAAWCEALLGDLVAAASAVAPGAAVTLVTRSVDLDDADAARLGVAAAGRWVVLVVSLLEAAPPAPAAAADPAGPALPAAPGWELAPRLSAVRQLVRSAGGVIRLRSAPARGAVLELFLPGVAGPPSAVSAAPASRLAETILVVEDERPVRELVCDVLRLQGYTVLEAADGEEALRVAERYPGPIDLVVADVVMPGPAAGELVERLRTLHPGLRALYTSGYAGEQVGRLLYRGAVLLEKPFSLDALVRAVREALDRGINGSGSGG